MSSLLGKKRVSFDETFATVIQPIAIRPKSLDNIKQSFTTLIFLESRPEKPVRSRFDNGYEMHVKNYIGLMKK